MAPEPYPIAPASSNSHAVPAEGLHDSANRSAHRIGADVNANDQLSSLILACLAIAGAVVALLLIRLIIG